MKDHFMLQNIIAPLPFKKRTLLFYSFLSFFLGAFLFTSGLYLYLIQDVKDKTSLAKTSLAEQMDIIFIELKEVVDHSILMCEEADIRHLRSSTFNSSMFKEFGLFDSDFNVFCSDYGARNFSIFSSIAERIEQSADKKTVSLVSRTNTLGDKAFIAFYLGGEGVGANGLAPPHNLTDGVERILSADYPYKLTLGKLDITSSAFNEHIDLLSQQTAVLKNWAITLDVILPTKHYWKVFFCLLPFAFIAIVLAIIGLCFIHWCTRYYLHSLPHCLRRAIKNNEMDVNYQPILTLDGSSVKDMEALVRWTSPYHGRVSPLSIVEVSRRLGMIDDLTWMVIRKVGLFYREHQNTLNDVNVAVNIDRQCLLADSFVGKLAAILEEFPELKGNLGLEVTETCALNDVELPLMVSRFEHIKALGIHLSVDDFGTGYSGLDFLRRFPYDSLKLDKVFISTLKEDPFTGQILNSVISLAKELDMTVVAEGVEREEQLQAVKNLGVDKVQGYYFSSPLSKEHIITWLDENKTSH